MRRRGRRRRRRSGRRRKRKRRRSGARSSGGAVTRVEIRRRVSQRMRGGLGVLCGLLGGGDDGVKGNVVKWKWN